MECNRDEALRARQLAEIKYSKQDFVGAKKFVLKAQQLFPGLEGLSQMLQVLEVHAVAQSKLGGIEMDWYGILQVDPSADDGTIKKQYRKLALLLHPDKNKAVGAEAAFKLIGEAWGILSDKMKRQMHDMKRNIKSKASHVRVVMEPNVQAFQTSFNATSVPPTANPPQTGQTFWTACPSCKMQYQYLRTYENYKLQCPKCKEVFLARDIQSAATTNGAGGFGWHFDAHRQDFGFNKPPANPAFNGAGAGAGNGFMDGGMGGFSSSFPNQASSAAFFSSAAAAAAAQSKVAAAAAAAAAASSAVPPNNLAADVVQQTFHKVKRERVEAEKEVKRKEKELRKKEKDEIRKEKEEQRKAREAERSREAMERLVAKRNEAIAKDEGKRKVDARAGRKLKRKKRDNEQEDDEDLEDEDPKIYEQTMQDDLSSPALPRRRSSRAKKNVATYKVDISDDSDLEDFPAKRAKLEGGAEDGAKSEDEEAVRQQSENGTKGKSVANDNNHVKRGVGANSGEELDGHRHVTERNRGDQGGAAKKDPHSSNSVETPKRSDSTVRESKLHDSPSVTHRTKGGKSLQQAESPLTGKENCHEGEKFSKPETFRDDNSPSKSPRTLRNRVRSPKVPFGSQSVHIEQDEIPQQRVSSPAVSIPSSEPDSEEDEVQKIEVADPDFHDFDKYRTEVDIRPGQIWALYDDQDGMPRFYGRIYRATTKPFKANVNWLEHSALSDKDAAWTESTGLSIAYGEFKIGTSTVMDQINCFSHKVLEKSGKGILKIHPKRGQVWAVYRDWDPAQRTGPSRVARANGGSTYNYDMVEILSEFSEEKSLKTAVLLKIPGFKTVFRRQDGMEAVRYFKPTELVKFSHNVPIERIDDPEADQCGIPRGSVELDPASTPLDLIIPSSPSNQSR